MLNEAKRLVLLAGGCELLHVGYWELNSPFLENQYLL